MTDPRQLSIDDFDYSLPAANIAHYPAIVRDSSRLLIWNQGTISETRFSQITDFLPARSLVVFNNTRVVEARLLFQKPTGAQIEVFCLHPPNLYPDITRALAQHGAVAWNCLVGNAAAWTEGLVLTKTLHHAGGDLTLQAKLLKKETDYYTIGFEWSPADLSFAEVLHHAGLVPLPPYIRRDVEAADAQRYQTVYAHLAGSVAAPTAGLHFTGDLIDRFSEKKIEKDFVTLHVGAGTFKPVKANKMSGHEMHSESIEVSLRLLKRLLQNSEKNIIAVGTTSLRTLESLYWLGEQLIEDPTLSLMDLHVLQWKPYEARSKDLPMKEALHALAQRLDTSGTDTLIARTSLLIAPGYRFRIVSGLVTNFHQPRSTLLLLVSAFIGEEWKSVYAYALENNFRFLSYGDACLLFRK